MSCRRSGSTTDGPGGRVPKPVIRDVSNETGSVVIAEDEALDAWKLAAGPDPAGRSPSLLFCDNETNLPKLFGGGASTPYPKDGVNDHVVNGAATVNPERRGTKMACWHRVTVGAGETVELRLRLARDTPGKTMDLGEAFAQTQADRSREADEYYAVLRPGGNGPRVFVTIHPSALLRLQDEEEKRSGHASFVNDLRSIERLLQFLGDGEGPTFAPPSSVVPRSALNP
jgi:hypothetical protein